MPLKLFKYILGLCCMLLLSTLPCKASGTQRQSMTQGEWQQLSSDKAFDYKDKREYVAKKEPTPRPVRSGNAWANFLEFFTRGAGEVLLWLLLFSVVAYMLYYILLSKNMGSLFSRSKKVYKAEATSTDNLEDISGTDWDNMMYDAIIRRDYRNAIRYSYLALLQLLQERELISYRTDKTNYDYYHELADTQYKGSFKQLSRQYEYAWYGHFAIPDSSFDQYLAEFNRLKKQLN